jgi:hypothetical protein
MGNLIHPSIREALKQVPALRWAKSFAELKYYQRRRDKGFARQQVQPHPNEQADWERALDDELRFWRWALGQGHFDDRLQRDRHIQAELARLLDERHTGPTEAVVIDVGSGPLTTVGTVWAHPMRVIAIDPLADRYNALMDEMGIIPPVRPVRGSAEHLSSVIPHGSADLLVMNNALDHSYQPLRCVLNLVATAKPGCFVHLSHFANEAEKERYAGLHQWNIFRRGRDTIISSRTEEHSLTQLLAGRATVSTRTRFEKHGIVETLIRRLPV